MNRLPGLDLLRAVAITWVMLYHVTSYGVSLPLVVEFGWMGVDLFFVLSGYLIGAQLLKPYACGKQPKWAAFFLRRAMRVLPAYLTVLALYFAVPAMRESPGIQPLWQFLLFTQNMFSDYSQARAFSHVWSLCIEEHFYLILPPVVWSVARQPGAGKTASIILATLAGGMLLRGWIWQHDVAPFLNIRDGADNFFERFIESIYNPTYARLDGLLAGVTLAVVQTFRPVWWSWATARGSGFMIAGFAGVVVSMCMENPSVLWAVAGFPLLSWSLAAILVGAVSPRTMAGRWRVPGAGAVAAMAFSLYLTHKAVYHLVREQLGAYLPSANLLALGVYLGAALAAGALLFLAVERPGMRLRERFARATPAAIGMPAAAT
jgi:peptidoglycan/LPS O-acetylase OafA/YrhL